MLSFVALCPLFISIHRIKHLYSSFFYGFVYGLVYFTLLCSWLYNFHPLALPLVVTLRSVQYSFVFFVLVLCTRVFRHKSSLLISSVYVALGYLLECGFLGLSYGNIAYALYRYPLLIQCADIVGLFGVLFVLSFTSSVLASFFVLKDKRKSDLILVVILVAFVVIYGNIRLTQKDNQKVQNEFDVIAVQHNVNSHSVNSSSYMSALDSLIELSIDGIYKHPQSSLLIWSETAVIPPVSWFLNHPSVSDNTRVADRVVTFSSSIPMPLLFGNGDAVLQDEKLSKELSNAKYYNAAVLIHGGMIGQKYYKQHLVPFSEHFPYREIFPHFYKLLISNNLTFWDKGEQTVVFDIPINNRKQSVKVFTPICFEDTFAYISRRGVRNGAKMIINLTNDSWSMSSASQNQHLSAGVFRSVENSVPTVRCTNSGATCYIDESGRISGTLDYFTKGYGVYNVKIKQSGQTLYTVLGDIPVICFTVSVLSFLFIVCIRRIVRKESI